MPSEPDIPDELPAELIAVESLLQQFSPTVSAMNRDALLYEAGWAAAKMQAQTKSHWFWPATSAALAAALLFVIISPVASSLQRAGAEPPPPSPPALQTQTQTHPTPEPAPEAKFVRTSPVPLKRYSPKAPFLAMRERALRLDFDEFPIDTLSDDFHPPLETTNRQLLQQLLPGSRTRSTRPSIWPSWNLGETS